MVTDSATAKATDSDKDTGTAPVPRWEHAVVTGGAGFVGSHLCSALLRQGTAVTCVDDFCTGSPENVAHLQDRPGFLLLNADVTEPFDVGRRADLVLYFASPASPSDYLRLPLHTLETGSAGTRNSLATARRCEARFVLASTSEPTATRSSTRRARATGATSTPSVRAASTTRPSASPRR